MDKFNSMDRLISIEEVLMFGKIVFPIIASLLPVIISNLLQENLGKESTTILILSGFVSFVLLVIIQLLLENIGRQFSKKNNYCGHWVEEMTLYRKNEQGEDFPVKRMIGKQENMYLMGIPMI